MTDEQFLKGFAEVLTVDEASLTLDMPLASLEAWDSVAYLAAMIFVEENLGVVLDPDVLVNAKTVAEILASARTLQPV